MKTNFLLFAIALLMGSTSSFGQVRTSVADGSWTNPLNWNPVGVPISEDTVYVNHAMEASSMTVLDAEYLIINSGASITCPAMFTLNGNLINDGDLDIEWLTIAGADETENNGLIDATTMVLANVLFTNNGDISVDSLSSGNDDYVNNGDIDANIIAWGGTKFDNFGSITATQFIPGAGDVENHPSAVIDADSITVGQQLDNYGEISGTFMTTGLTINNHATGNIDVDQLIYGTTTLNEGAVHCINLTTPTGTVSGSTGTFCIDSCWVNAANVTGTVDFCDATQMQVCDINTGTIAVTVTFCVSSACTVGTGEAQIASSLSMYPNPASDLLNIKLANEGRAYGILIIAIDGKIMYQQQNLTDSITQIDVSEFPVGTYILRVTGFEFLIQEKLNVF